jgi:glycosyltransferase involved in cell wall biosynthesis
LSGEVGCFPLGDLSPEILLSPIKMRAFFFPSLPVREDIRFLQRYSGRPVKYLYHRMRLDLAMLMGREASFRRYHMTSTQWRSLRFPKREPINIKILDLKLMNTFMERGDNLVLLGSSWKDWHTKAFVDLHNAGLVVTTLVHDLIPILNRGTADKGMAPVFHDWLLSSADYTQKYMANSESTREDLLNFLSIYKKTQSVEVLALTQTSLTTAKPEQKTDGPSFQRVDRAHFGYLIDEMDLDEKLLWLASTPYVLCVGTIEGRKNGWRLAMAWKKLINEGHEDIPRLIFAGRRGWNSQPLFDLLHGTGNLYGYVSVLEGPSDEELDFLYRNCTFTAFPSLYEGWGLPVGESLSYGKTAVVSNTSSLPEVGLDLVEYCDPSSIASIAAAVSRLTKQPERRIELEARIKIAKLRSWPDVAQDLFRILAQ